MIFKVPRSRLSFTFMSSTCRLYMIAPSSLSSAEQPGFAVLTRVTAVFTRPTMLIPILAASRFFRVSMLVVVVIEDVCCTEPEETATGCNFNKWLLA
jgi:hypothetical protein